MKYVMKDGSDVTLKIKNVLNNASETQFEKYMPKEPDPEPVKEFDNTSLAKLIKESAWVEKFGGYQIVAMENGVDIELVKKIEQMVIETKEERFPDTKTEV